MSALATMAAFSGRQDADQLSADALALGEALDVEKATLADLLVVRSIVHGFADRTVQSVMYCREAARIAEEAGATAVQARALLNLASVTAVEDLASAAEAARDAITLLRHVGNPLMLATAVVNFVIPALEMGRWDEADETLQLATGTDGIDQPFLWHHAALVHTLRSDTVQAREIVVRSRQQGIGEGPQELAFEALVESLMAHVEGDSAASLRYARDCLGFADVLGMRCESSRWSWCASSRAAYELGDDAAVEELLGLLDSLPPGHVPPLLKAERRLARARLASSRQAAEADSLFNDALQALRTLGSPWHLAHGLVGAAQHHQCGDVSQAAALLHEAQETASAVGALPVLERVAKVEHLVRRSPVADTVSG